MITIKCYYGFRSVQGLTVKTIEEARKLREDYRGQLASTNDRWRFVAKDENGNIVLGSN